MHAVLVVHLEGLLSSWADCTRHKIVKTRREPTKSAMAGILCVVCGRPFEDDDFVRKVAACEYVFRTDAEGFVVADFSVTRDVPRSNGEPSDGNLVVVDHEYLEGAVHKAAIGGDLSLLRELEDAFRFPRNAFSLGKKACVPTAPAWTPGCLVTTGETPLEVLSRWPWKPPRGRRRPTRLRVTTDLGVGSTEGELRHDHPISLNPANRRHADRRVGTVWVPTEGLPRENVAAEESTAEEPVGA